MFIDWYTIVLNSPSTAPKNIAQRSKFSQNDDLSFAIVTSQGHAVLDMKGSLRIPGYVRDPMFALVFEIELEVTIPRRLPGTLEFAQTPEVRQIVLGFGIYLPFDELSKSVLLSNADVLPVKLTRKDVEIELRKGQFSFSRAMAYTGVPRFSKQSTPESANENTNPNMDRQTSFEKEIKLWAKKSSALIPSGIVVAFNMEVPDQRPVRSKRRRLIPMVRPETPPVQFRSRSPLSIRRYTPERTPLPTEGQHFILLPLLLSLF